MSENTRPEKKKKQPTKAVPQQIVTERKKEVTRIQPTKSPKVQMAVEVPECVRHYYSAVTNPCDAKPGACLPADLFPLPTQKVVGFARGTFRSGTTGFGFITMNPALSSDSGSAVHTSASTSVGTAVTAINAYTNRVAIPFANLPFTNAQFAAGGVLGRTVAYGMRIRCLDPILSRGGQCVYGETPDHSDVGPLSYQDLDNSRYSRTTRIVSAGDPNGWDAAVSSSGPVQTVELQFTDNNSGAFGGNTDTIFICVSTPSAGALFEFEAFIHQEYIGRSVAGKSASHADPMTLSKVTEVLKNHTAVGPLTPEDAQPLWKSILMGIANALPRLVEVGVGAAKIFSGNPGGLLDMAGAAVGVGSDHFQAVARGTPTLGPRM